MRLRYIFSGIFVCLTLQSVLTASMWPFEDLSHGSINLRGGLSQTYEIGNLGSLDSEHFPIQLVHTLAPYPLGEHKTFSKWEVPQLTTYVVPNGPHWMLWVTPGGQEVLFNRSKEAENRLVDDLPAELPEGWTMRMPKGSPRIEIHSDEGWVYVYQDGEIQTLELPSGRKLYFETELIQVKSVSLQDSGKTTVLLDTLYDDLGRLSQIRMGPVWHSFTYEEDTELLKQWLPFGIAERATRFDYRDGLVSTIHYPSGKEEAYQWQTDVSNYSPGKGLQFDRFELSAILLSDGDYSYSIGENQEGIHLVSTNRLDQEERLIYNPLTKRLVTIDRGGLRREMHWNTNRSTPAGDKLIGVIAPDGDKLVELEYDKAGRVSVIRKRGEAPITFSYDADDRLLERRRGEYPPFQYSYELDSEEPSKITDPLGHVTEYRFRPDGQIEDYRDLSGGLHRFFYDEFGRLIRRVYPMDVWVAYSRDEYGRIVGISHSNGSETEKTYDEFNQIRSAVANGIRWEYRYDRQGRLLQVMRNDEIWQEISYQTGDDQVRIVITDDEENRSQGLYDIDGKLLAETNPLGTTINYRYDPIGQLEGWTDQEEGVIDFALDESGNIIGQANALKQETKKYYDDLGRLSLRDNTEQKIKVEYDEAERISSIDYGTGQVLGYEYDDYGRIRETTSGKLKTSFAYNAMDQRIGRRTIYPDGSKDDLIFTYAPSGKRQTMRLRRYDKAGTVIKDSDTVYKYDELGRTVLILVNNSPVATYHYDPKTLLLSEKISGSGDRMRFDYNRHHQLEAVSTLDGEGNRLQFLDYIRDSKGQLIGTQMTSDNSDAMTN